VKEIKKVTPKVKGVDLIVVRENTGGAYFGQPKKQWMENGKCRATGRLASGHCIMAVPGETSQEVLPW